MISYDDFAKVEIRAGKILSAEKVDNADKLLKLSVDFGMIPADPVAPEVTSSMSAVVPSTPTPEPRRDVRQIVSGISLYFPDPVVLVGKTCMFVTNLAPRTIRGLESNGMLFALSTDEGHFSLLEPNKDIPPGTRAY